MSLIEEQRENLTALQEASIPVVKKIELWQSGTTAKYSSSELEQILSNNEVIMTYKGYIVVAWSYAPVGSEFKFVYVRASNDMTTLQYVGNNKISNYKIISGGNVTRTVPFTVNTKSSNTSGAITLNINDILPEATAGDTIYYNGTSWVDGNPNR